MSEEYYIEIESGDADKFWTAFDTAIEAWEEWKKEGRHGEVLARSDIDMTDQDIEECIVYDRRGESDDRDRLDSAEAWRICRRLKEAPTIDLAIQAMEGCPSWDCIEDFLPSIFAFITAKTIDGVDKDLVEAYFTDEAGRSDWQNGLIDEYESAGGDMDSIPGPDALLEALKTEQKGEVS